jgi:hypothetical protein
MIKHVLRRKFDFRNKLNLVELEKVYTISLLGPTLRT